MSQDVVLSNIFNIKLPRKYNFSAKRSNFVPYSYVKRYIPGIIPTEDSQFSSKDVVLSDSVI